MIDAYLPEKVATCLEILWWWPARYGREIMPALPPIAALYGRMRYGCHASRPDPASVICVGHRRRRRQDTDGHCHRALLKSMGKAPAFLTRGYGGNAKGVVPVAGHEAKEVGDEALLLAAAAPAFVSADRAAGAKAIEQTNADVLVMDDGFQNPGLVKDLSLIVADASSGIGNGRVIPSGPLRAPLDTQLPRADALLVIGDGKKCDRLIERFEAAGKPVFRAKVMPNCDPRWLSVLPAIGFAGIARPQVLRRLANGARLIASHAFGDHHRFTEKEAKHLLAEAEEKKAMLVTTEKDWARLADEDDDEDGSPLAELKKRSRPFPIVIAFENEEAVKSLLSEAIGGGR